MMAATYESRSMTSTTNIEFSRWGTVLGDDKLATAAVDRKCEASHFLSIAADASLSLLSTTPHLADSMFAAITIERFSQ